MEMPCFVGSITGWEPALTPVQMVFMGERSKGKAGEKRQHGNEDSDMHSSAWSLLRGSQMESWGWGGKEMGQ